MKFKVGDVCVTQGSRMPLLNDGSTVVVIAIDPGVKAYGGDCAPYRIRRVDGQRFAYSSTLCGKDNFYAMTEVWCRERMLRRFDEPQSRRSAAKRTTAKKLRDVVKCEAQS